MKLLERYNSTITFFVEKPKEYVYGEVIKAFKNSQVIVDKIDIIVKPTFLDPFAGRGLINIYLAEFDKGAKTRIICKITPTSINQNGLYGLSFLLIGWAIVSLLISHTFYTYVTIILGWSMFIIVIHFTQVLNSGKLENYINDVFANIQGLKQKSIA